MADEAAKRSANRRHFDRWAESYERDRTSRRLATLQHEALGMLALTTGDRLLDVGCGTGAALRSAAATVERAVGVDLSSAMVARGRELAAATPNVELREADAEALPFDDGAFTAALCTTSMHHYQHPDRAIAQIARVLAPGGRAVIADATTDRPIMRLADLVLRTFQRSHVGLRRAAEIGALMRAAGLEPRETRRLMGGVYAMVVADKR